MFRYLAVVALVIAGLIRAPFLSLNLTEVPAHQIYYDVLSVLQLACAFFLLIWGKPISAYHGLLITATSIILVILSMLVDMPFTNVNHLSSTLEVIAVVFDLIALILLLLFLDKTHKKDFWSSYRWLSLRALVAGGLIWGMATVVEPQYPQLAHNQIDQFEVFDQIAMLSATDYAWELPAGFPVPAVPEDNPMSEAKVMLGRYIFYDNALSRDNTMSCSSCHLQPLAFSDGIAVPVGVTGESHTRNSQTLTNVAYNASYTWGNPVLTQIEHQTVIPIFGEFPVEMGVTGHEDVVLARFQESPLYQQLFEAAFPDDPEPISFHNLTLALSSFVRTMISGNSPYDQFVYQQNYEALSESALRGLDLFLSEKFECHHCHGGFNFSASTLHSNTTFPERPFFNTGLYNIGENGAYPRGNTGVFEVTGNPTDMGRFRPPTLRNIELTAPYMHDGSIATLEDVILFYADGGRLIEDGIYAGDGRANPNKSGFVPGFEITDQEMEDMLNFLTSLTDETFITDERLSNPFISD
jgi:cytochrome c peroxidase